MILKKNGYFGIILELMCFILWVFSKVVKFSKNQNEWMGAIVYFFARTSKNKTLCSNIYSSKFVFCFVLFLINYLFILTLCILLKPFIQSGW